MLNIAAKVGKGVKGPNSYQVSKIYLNKEVNAMKECIKYFRPTWKERELLSCAMDGQTRDRIINFLIYCNKGRVFHKSIDAFNVPSRTLDYYFRLLDMVVEKIRQEYVIQIVIDNGATFRATGKKLMEKRPCLY